MTKRLIAALALIGLVLPTGTVEAAPLDTWPITHGIDCVGDPYNPVRGDGTRDPEGDPLAGTDEWAARGSDNVNCSKQRDHDKRYQPVDRIGSARYGEDWYRQPVRFDGRRFRFTYMPSSAAAPAGAGIPGVPAAEIYRPCTVTTCPALPDGLQYFEPPFPVVIVHHGFIAQMSHHRFNAQVFAEHGYMAISVNGTHPASGAPNVQSNQVGGNVLDWLATPESGVFGQEADLSRIAMSGHSQGSAASLSYQGDPRVDAIIAWDGGDSVSVNNCTIDEESGERRPCAPIMYQRTDGAFASGLNTSAPTDYPANRNRGLATYDNHKARGMNVFHATLKATSHVDWNGYGVGLGGNRLAELWINYYNLAWLDRHLNGKLNIDGDGSVEATHGRTETEERQHRQDIAADAVRRLTAMRFDDSADVHNTSMGFFDPVQLATSGDPLYGGNVPYRVRGLFTTDRYSPYYRHFCHVTLPNYVDGGTGAPDDPVAPLVVADSGGYDESTDTYGDMRYTGCS